MKLSQLHESSVIRSHEGEIDSAVFDGMIMSAIHTYSIDPAAFQEIKDTVIDDYLDSDISQVTVQDIVQIMDASGIGEPSDPDEDRDPEAGAKHFAGGTGFNKLHPEDQKLYIKKYPKLAKKMGYV